MFTQTYKFIAVAAGALALTACGSNENQRDPNAEVVDCALDGAADFAKDCTIERNGSEEGLVLTIGRDALTLLLLISMPVLGVVMAVGLLVSIFQAVTQIHEATLAFVPKLIAAMVVFAIAGPWMLSTLVDFIRRTIESIPSMIG